MPARRTRRTRRTGARARARARSAAARRGPAARTRSADGPARGEAGPTLRAFQQAIEATYGTRDRARGLPATFMWLAEEVGELSRALRASDRANLEEEFADVLAWLCTLASLAGVDMATAAGKYAGGCPRCAACPCACRHRAPAAGGRRAGRKTLPRGPKTRTRRPRRP